jgi:hypothetical protein
MIRHAWYACLVLSGALAAPLLAQGDCFPGASSNEARVFGILSVPLAFTAAGAPAESRRWSEATYLSRVDGATATPTVCRPGKGPENVNLLPGFLRPRISVGLPARFLVELGWVPPIRVRGASANLVGLALARIVPAGAFRLAFRAEATLGVIHAPREIGNGGLTLYGGAGYSHLAPRFRVNFTNRFNETDRRRVEVDLDRLTLTAGATLRLSSAIGLTAEAHAAPADAVTGRMVVRTTWRQ